MTGIALYHWAETDAKTRAHLLIRAQADIADVTDQVRPIIEDVKKRGDAALVDYAKKFDGADLGTIKAEHDEFERAGKNLDMSIKDAIRFCADNVHRFHEEQMRHVETSWMHEVRPGVWAGEQVTPIDSVGLYVPRGKGAFPSTMLMLCTAAKIAGVPEISVVTPPRADGSADDASLFTAKLCGVDNVYKTGGAQAVAALAFGTQTIPKAHKITGPGSPYVQAAKQLLFAQIDPGTPASSSEAIILCDESADPHNTCLDILNEAEHGEDSASLLVTHDKKLSDYVRQHLPGFIAALPEPHRSICAFGLSEKGYGGIILTENLADSIAFANEYAPEHLHLKVKNPDDVVRRLRNAGEILVGEHTGISIANYAIGVNHVLPTGGAARSYSCISVWDFLKRTSLARVDVRGFAALKDATIAMAEYEDFPSHAATVRKRSI
ncbi:MAG: histidinol dehydrogenase [Alphaproteobacteria bacterium]